MTDELVSLVLDEAREKMTKAVTHARQAFASIRTGRAAPGLVEKLPVEYYGSEVPLQQMANISVPDWLDLKLGQQEIEAKRQAASLPSLVGKPH